MSQIVRFDLSAVQHFEAAVLCSSCHVMLVHLDRRDLCLEECIFMIKATFAAARWCFILCYVTARRQWRPWGLEVNTGRRWNAVEKTCYEAVVENGKAPSCSDFELKKLLIILSDTLKADLLTPGFVIHARFFLTSLASLGICCIS